MRNCHPRGMLTAPRRLGRSYSIFTLRNMKDHSPLRILLAQLSVPTKPLVRSNAWSGWTPATRLRMVGSGYVREVLVAMVCGKEDIACISRSFLGLG